MNLIGLQKATLPGLGPWRQQLSVPGPDLASRVQRQLAPALVIGPGRGRGAMLLNGVPAPRAVQVGEHDVVGFAVAGRLLDREWRRLGLVELELCPTGPFSSEATLSWIDRSRPRPSRIGTIDIAVRDVVDELVHRLERSLRSNVVVISATPVARPVHVA